MGICIYIWNLATESEVADTEGSTATTTRRRTKDDESNLTNWAVISPTTSISRLWLNHPFEIRT